LLESNPF